MTTIAIVANSVIHDYEKVGAWIKKFPFVIAADGGLHNCHQMDISPNLIIGDFDSVSPELLQKYSHVPQKTFPVDKDKTDLELAIEEAVSHEVEKIVIFGALEKRLDHTVYNLYLLQRYPGKLFIESEYETLFVINEKTHITCFPDQVVSLMPLGEAVNGITTNGLKWELDDATFNKDFMSLSNVCLSNSFQISVDKGNILCSLCK